MLVLKIAHQNINNRRKEKYMKNALLWPLIPAAIVLAVFLSAKPALVFVNWEMLAIGASLIMYAVSAGITLALRPLPVRY